MDEVDMMEKHSLYLLVQGPGTGRQEFGSFQVVLSLEHVGGLSSQDLPSTRSLTSTFSPSSVIAGDRTGRQIFYLLYTIFNFSIFISQMLKLSLQI